MSTFNLKLKLHYWLFVHEIALPKNKIENDATYSHLCIVNRFLEGGVVDIEQFK